ncbi:hypothetical protein L9F63_017862 [Diploptera punctata]|uniref:Uncharacterized protein n=1 Tax=Diploptera punctata TaxID=6984 RepID=A0AAD8EGA4_DIPPU|nr:hypothetical protein L9F63_017862 [Diploptera punctata]
MVDIMKKLQVVLLISFCLSYVQNYSATSKSPKTREPMPRMLSCPLPNRDLNDLPNSFQEVRKFIECNLQSPKLLAEKLERALIKIIDNFYNQSLSFLINELKKRHAVQDKIIQLSGNKTSPEIQACLDDKMKSINEAVNIGDNKLKSCIEKLGAEIEFFNINTELPNAFQKDWNSTLEKIDKCLGEPSSPQNKEKLKCVYDIIDRLLVEFQYLNRSEMLKIVLDKLSIVARKLFHCRWISIDAAEKQFDKTHKETVECFGPDSDPSVIEKAKINLAQKP